MSCTVLVNRLGAQPQAQVQAESSSCSLGHGTADLGCFMLQSCWLASTGELAEAQGRCKDQECSERRLTISAFWKETVLCCY